MDFYGFLDLWFGNIESYYWKNLWILGYFLSVCLSVCRKSFVTFERYRLECEGELQDDIKNIWVALELMDSIKVVAFTKLNLTRLMEMSYQ